MRGAFAKFILILTNGIDDMINDVIIIGGGASGLCAAICLKQKNPYLSVKLFERQPRVGKKLATTGNGRCNISNKNITLDRYHGKHLQFCEYALKKYNHSAYVKFFESIGVPFVYEGDRAYPASFQAASVVDCLRFAAEELGVMIYTDTKITNIQISGGKYKIIADKINFLAENVIVATGLFSGGEKLGCDGSMLSVLKKSGFSVVNTTPAIVQLKTVTDIVKQLKGIKVNANATLKAGNKIIRTEYGETLFCDYGLSGPPILQISREVSRIRDKCVVSLDLMPETEFDELVNILENRVKNLKSRNLNEFFTGMLNKRLGQVILKLCDCRLNDMAVTLDNLKIKKIASVIKNICFEVTGTAGFSSSQVTAGGLETTQFDDKTMMSESSGGLYAIGEILDIDGDCGGFNLAWAWSSAMCAADAIISSFQVT